MLKIIECPRDAMQGIKDFIDTDHKIAYINQLLKVGFDTLDAGSFVSAKAIPQMQDSEIVFEKIDWKNSNTKLLAIVANARGAETATKFEQIKYIGYPFSISETFQIRNTNATIEESLDRTKQIIQLCNEFGKEPVIYISMGFGNPYGDEWNASIVMKWCERLIELGVKIISLSDTIGVSNPDSISYLFNYLIPKFPTIEFGAHLHTQPTNWLEKVDAAYKSGCRRFDGALKGYGGCPMAKDDLTGNMPTENMIMYFNANNISNTINVDELNKSLLLSSQIFH
jgi:hydroxymethylglutaryl-CoA lyase